MNRCPLDEGGLIGPTTSIPHISNGQVEVVERRYPGAWWMKSPWTWQAWHCCFPLICKGENLQKRVWGAKLQVFLKRLQVDLLRDSGEVCRYESGQRATTLSLWRCERWDSLLACFGESENRRLVEPSWCFSKSPSIRNSFSPGSGDSLRRRTMLGYQHPG